MKVVVITGSTKGIGYGMAEAVLGRGHSVVLCSRQQADVDRCIAALGEQFEPTRVHGKACDVSQSEQIKALWDAAIERFGRVDIWVNNAARIGPSEPFWELTPEQIEGVVSANVTGVMLCANIVLAAMKKQGNGALYNMEGFGSDGRKMSGMALYGTTKYGVRYLTESLVKEVKDTPLIVGTLSPGMVITEMLVGDYDKSSEEWTKIKKLFNILADTTETVCPWLAERFLNNTKNGAAFRWLTTPKIIGRFLSAPFVKRDIFANLPDKA